MTPEKIIIGNAELWYGDCREILPTLPRPDAIFTDPPYGQLLNTNVTGKSVAGSAHGSGRAYAMPGKQSDGSQIKFKGCARQFPDGIAGDDEPFDPAMLLSASDRVMLWGAHKFSDRLPRGRHLVWDKVPTGKIRDQGDGETAWTNVDPDAVLRIYRMLWDGICVGSAARHEVMAGMQRVHPAQKPVALMAWCLPFLKVPAGGVISDPYAGSGPIGLAALDAGYRYVGIELVREYFDTMCRRIDDAQRQARLII